jgi:cell division protein FtsI/penicillin-binding protein 2
MPNILQFPRKRRRETGKPFIRLPFLFLSMAAFLLVIGVRLVSIQAVQAEKFDDLARNQRFTSVELPPDRGAIYDRNGEIMAISIEMETVFATPYQVEDPRRAARKLAPILQEKRSTIYKKLVSDSGFAYLKRKVDRRTADKVRELKIDGIGLLPESKRFYPGKTLASQTLGFVGMDNVGLAGLELTYDSYLRGKPGKLQMEQDLYGRPIPGGEFKLEKASDGRNIVLTIDKEIQYKAQVELKRAIKEHEAAGGWIVVMNSKNGEIYALANEPTFDLNKFYTADSSIMSNRLLEDTFEPGSTMKVITAAAALEERLFSASDSLTLPGTIRVGGYTIGEAHARETREFTFAEIVTQSSNIGSVHIGEALGKQRLYQYISRFGLNRETALGLPGEAQGYVLHPDSWSASTIATVSFGQGLSVTALGMVRAVNVVASDGLLIEPKIVKEIIDSKGKARAIKREAERERVISKSTAVAISKILADSITSGTGGAAKIDGYEAAGKTGTAQKPSTETRGYDPGKYVSSFIGFAPVDDPAITILVALDEPRGQYYGGVVAAPVFAEVGAYALQRLQIEP